MPSSFRARTAVQMITQSLDVRDPQHALTWSRRLALCPFWCLDAKGGESLGIFFMVCFMVSTFSVLCRCVFSRFALFGCVPVRPKFQTYGVRHMLPYLSNIFIYVYLAYELHAYPVIYVALIYHA